MVFFYTTLKRHVQSNIAMIGTFITFTVPHVIGDITTGYVDLNVAFFGCLAAILIFEWMNDTSKKNYFYLSALFIGGAAWTHNEGLILYGAMILTLLAYFAIQYLAKKIGPVEIAKCLVFFFAIYTAVYGPFKALVAYFKLKPLWVQSFWQLFNILPNLPKVPVILGFMCYEIFLNTYLWQYFWIMFLIFTCLNRKMILNSNLKFLLLFIIFAFAMIFEAFYVSGWNTTDALIGILRLNLDRAINILPPTAGFLMFASFKEQKD
jgi:hypothetical protein